MTFTVTRRRSIIKTLLYRALGTAETFIVVLLVGGSTELASIAAITLMLVKLCMYYVYERAWNCIKWGRY